MKNIDDLMASIADDAVKGEVLKTHIQEVHQTERAKATDSDYQAWKWLAIGATVLITFAGSCVGYHAVDAWQQVKTDEIHAAHPAAFTPAPSATAFTIKPVGSAVP